MKEAKLSVKNQIVIPKEICRQAKIKPGDSLIFDFFAGSMIAMVKPKSHSEKLLGLQKDIWKNLSSEDYLKAERASWDNAK